MGSLLQNTVFGKSNYKANTFIGGVASTINTPSLAAAKLGISSSRIKLFQIVGNDIKFAVTDGSYILPQNFMGDVSALTYFIDLKGFITSNAPTLGKMFLRCYNLETVYMPGMTRIYGIPSNWTFENTYGNYTKWKIFYIPNVIYYGSDTGGSGSDVFRNNFSNSIKIYAHPSMQTINNGSVENDLALFDAIGNNSINYVQNLSKPSQIINLSVTEIYNTSLKLNFTIPDSTNTIDYYEVYLNGIYSYDIKNNGDTINGLLKNTNYKIELIAVDIFYNKSILSNSIDVTSANYSDSYYENTDEATAYINASGLNTTSEIESSKHIIFQLINNSLWKEIHALYLFKGSSSTQHKWNAKNPIDINNAFRLTFNGTGSYSNLGFQLNGINAYANTYFNPISLVSYINYGLTVVSGTSNVPTSNDAVEIGVSSNSNNLTRLALRNSNTSPSYTNISITGNVCSNTFTDAKGIFTGSKTSTTKTTAFRNGNLIGTNVTANASSTIYNGNIYIGCENNGNVPKLYSNQRLQMAIIHKGLSDSQVTKLHEIIDISESIAGRKTW